MFDLARTLVPSATYLPPLGCKGRHRSAGDSDIGITHPIATVSTAIQKQKKRISCGESLPSNSFGAFKPPPGIEPDGDPKAGGAPTADVIINTYEPAGITFKWTKTSTMEGLTVVDVVDGSVAARHGGVVPGMFLVGVNKRSFAGFTQEAIMQVMQGIARQPRILSLARVGRNNAPAHGYNLATNICSARVRGAEALRAKTHDRVGPEANVHSIATPELWQENPNSQHLSRPSRSSSRIISTLSIGAATTLQPRIDSSSYLYRRPAPGESSGRLRAGSAELSTWDSDDEAWSTGNFVTNCSSSPSNIPLFATWAQGSGRALSSKSDAVGRQENFFKQQDRILPLRFIGSRRNTSLFDRDHIMGVRKRDIEFIVSSGPRSERQKANSQRSLGELTRDWRNDPCSTPARRRRLINDVCKVIVRSYEHASVIRVVDFRQQTAVATKLQAIARMRAARTRYAAKISARRARAALCLQLAWLSHIARNRLWVLRDERDRVRRAKQLTRAREDILRWKEESAKAEREKNETAGRRHRLELATLLQRRFRSLQVTTTVKTLICFRRK